MGDLKPCPFCGDEARLRSAMNEFWAYCLGCGASGPMKSKKDLAQEAWSRRSNPHTGGEALAALREAGRAMCRKDGARIEDLDNVERAISRLQSQGGR